MCTTIRRNCIAAGVVVVNVSPAYLNPDAFARRLKRPRFDMRKVVADTVSIFSAIPLRDDPRHPNDQPEALAVILVDYDGVHRSRLVTGGLAPKAGSTIHYDAFIRRICGLYEQRFRKG